MTARKMGVPLSVPWWCEPRVLCSHPCKGEQRPSGCLLWRPPGLGDRRVGFFPWRFCGENLSMHLFSHNCILCLLPFFPLQKWKGFPWPDQVCQGKGVHYQEPLVSKDPSWQAGLNSHSKVSSGVSLTLLRAHIIFVTSKNPSWN